MAEAVSKNGMTDEVVVALNEPETGPEPGTTGPDPAQWPVADRPEEKDTFVMGGSMKGPGPEWDDREVAEPEG